MLELRKGPPAATVIASLKELEAKWQRPVLIIQTGSIAEDSLPCLLSDGHLPTFLAAYIKGAKYNHAFYCISKDVKVTKSILSSTGKELAGYLSLLEEEPLKTLTEWFIDIKFGLVILDSSLDCNEALAEFKVIEGKMEDGGIVIIDDVDPDNKVTQKGSLLIQHIRDGKRGYQFDNGMLKVFF